MTTPPPSNPLPGWYPDPYGGGGFRYWDGLNWTSVAPPGAGVPPASTPASPPAVPGPSNNAGMSKGGKIALGVGGAIVVMGAVVTAIGETADKAGNKSSESSWITVDPRPAEPGSGPGSRPDSDGPRSGSTPRSTKAAPAIAPAGSSVRDGKFEFEVLAVERFASKQGVFEPELPKGVFFGVKLRVTNVGDDARTFSASSQHLIVDGKKYDASVSVSDENWREDINPGLSIDATVFFDIPRGAVPEAIECHDSMFSGGALLALPES